MNSYFFKSALLPDGWQSNVRLTVEQGIIQTVVVNTKPQAQDVHKSVVIPAMPNVHSHVFQRAMAGLTEYKSQGQDSFWSWRDLMYQMANELDADTLYAVAKRCYTEMAAAGFASVCEFHYVHRAKDQPEDYISHSKIILQAAADVGLPITFLPVLYAYSGVGEQPLHAEQQRFELSTDEYIDLFKQLQAVLQDQQKLGICFHSIRAVSLDQMHTLIEALPEDAPIHIHIAEQQAEVEQSLAHHQMRPVSWLFKHFEVNQRWCLVHATHLDATEITALATSGAVAVLCPLTEANLGDGIFPMPAYQTAHGVWAIGSDSNIEIQPQQELKMLEYSQRLATQQRNVCCSQSEPHVGTWMWLQAVAGGNQASGFEVAGIAAGSPASVVELVSKNTQLQAAQVLDGWIFSDQTAAQSMRL